MNTQQISEEVHAPQTPDEGKGKNLLKYRAYGVNVRPFGTDKYLVHSKRSGTTKYSQVDFVG